MSELSEGRWSAFWVQKEGNSPKEYEDAYAADGTDANTPGLWRYAVADGVSETSFANIWAKMLVDSYCAGELNQTNFEAQVGALQEGWAKEVDLESHAKSPEGVPWFVERKVQTGAAATLVGLTLREPQDDSPGTWQAIAIGDCCFFQVRDDQLVGSFPLSRSGEFDRLPVSISSSPRGNDAVVAQIKTAFGSYQEGDESYLLSDAIAEWFLIEVEAGRKPWRELRAEAANDDSFEDWIAGLRGSNKLHNDDVTVLMLPAREADFVFPDEGELPLSFENDDEDEERDEVEKPAQTDRSAVRAPRVEVSIVRTRTKDSIAAFELKLKNPESRPIDVRFLGHTDDPRIAIDLPPGGVLEANAEGDAVVYVRAKSLWWPKSVGYRLAVVASAPGSPEDIPALVVEDEIEARPSLWQMVAGGIGAVALVLAILLGTAGGGSSTPPKPGPPTSPSVSSTTTAPRVP